MKRFSKPEDRETCREKLRVIQVPLPPSHAGIVAALRAAFQQLPEESSDLDDEENDDLQEDFRRILGRLN